jgi:hypothetical protein
MVTGRVTGYSIETFWGSIMNIVCPVCKGKGVCSHCHGQNTWPEKEQQLKEMAYVQMIGIRVKKPSGKPFKSGFKINTVTGVVVHPYHPKKLKGFTFVEDDSIVLCETCVPA